MSVSALIKPSRSLDFSLKPVLQCKEREGTTLGLFVTKMRLHSVTRFSESMLRVLIRNPVFTADCVQDGIWRPDDISQRLGNTLVTPVLSSAVLNTTNVTAGELVTRAW